MNTMQYNPQKMSGFSLIELMIVVGIIGALSAVAVPSYLGYIETGKFSAATANAETLAGFEDNYFYETGTYLAGSYNPPGANGLAALDWSPSGDNDKFNYDVAAGGCGDITKCFTVTVTHVDDASISVSLSRP